MTIQSIVFRTTNRDNDLESQLSDLVRRINSEIGSLVQVGVGSPNTVVTAPPGTLYLNLSGGASTTLYVKESGAGNTGWVAK